MNKKNKLIGNIDKTHSQNKSSLSFFSTFHTSVASPHFVGKIKKNKTAKQIPKKKYFLM
jgi:hypothetical protein